jgi:hypothetical protein
MKFSKGLVFVAVLMLATVVAYAADLTGSWKYSIETPNGAIEQTLVLKQDGDKLTGKVVSPRGETEIKDGKVKGNEFEFTVERPGRGGGAAVAVPYKGKMDGDTIKGSTGTGDRVREFTATRQK